MTLVNIKTQTKQAAWATLELIIYRLVPEEPTLRGIDVSAPAVQPFDNCCGTRW